MRIFKQKNKTDLRLNALYLITGDRDQCFNIDNPQSNKEVNEKKLKEKNGIIPLSLLLGYDEAMK